MSATVSWPGDWLRGVLEMAVLRVLANDQASYGYAISVALERNGLGAVKGGTLYPLLARLEQAAHVETRWEAGDGGPGRKYYTITDSGRSHLVAASSAWCEFAETTVGFLREGAPGIPASSRAATVATS